MRWHLESIIYLFDWNLDAIVASISNYWKKLSSETIALKIVRLYLWAFFITLTMASKNGEWYMKNGECLKFNQEEVNIIEVDMDQEHFDFSITVA